MIILPPGVCVIICSQVQNLNIDFKVFSCAYAKAERSLSSLSCVCVYVDQNKGTPHKWHIHWEFLDFKSGFGFTTNIYPR